MHVQGDMAYSQLAKIIVHLQEAASDCNLLSGDW